MTVNLLASSWCWRRSIPRSFGHRLGFHHLDRHVVWALHQEALHLVLWPLGDWLDDLRAGGLHPLEHRADIAIREPNAIDRPPRRWLDVNQRLVWPPTRRRRGV